MKKILLIGAGRSASSLIRYLKQHAQTEDWEILIADQDEKLAEEKARGHERCKSMGFDAKNVDLRKELIAKADLVISMLPASFHFQVAEDCIALKKNIITPSYISKEMQTLDSKAKEAGVLLLNEIGVDPGIDHMSAMKVLDEIRKAGGKINAFESFTGGLLAPESEKDNPWKYKFTWNPRNVVLAGQGGAVKFIQEGTYKYIPYHKLFRRTEFIDIADYGTFEGYANRDSLKYRSIYGLEDVKTIYRGTLRRKGYSRSWDAFVQLGATDDTYQVEGLENMTHRDFINLFLAYNPHDSVELKLMHYLKIEQDDTLMDKLTWLGLFEDTPIGLKEGTPAQILEHILKKKWSLNDDDKDMIVMWHKFVYQLNGETKELHSSMVSIGEDRTFTAMSNTVGIPLGIAARHILNGNIQLKGVQLPVQQEVYEPILAELEEYNITFKEVQVS